MVYKIYNKNMHFHVHLSSLYLHTCTSFCIWHKWINHSRRSRLTEICAASISDWQNAQFLPQNIFHHRQRGQTHTAVLWVSVGRWSNDSLALPGSPESIDNHNSLTDPFMKSRFWSGYRDTCTSEQLLNSHSFSQEMQRLCLLDICSAALPPPPLPHLSPPPQSAVLHTYLAGMWV